MILIGTSGWSYPAGAGTWNGIFYPPRGARGFKAGDELKYYAEHFDTVEVNSTFYRPPDASLARRWVQQTPPAFEFSVKLHQAFTHPMMRGRGAAPRTNVSPIPAPSPADLDAFRAGLEPIAAGDRLGMLLVQFPPAFHRSPESEEYLAMLLGAWQGYPLAVELRHRTWSDARAATAALLGAHGATWVQIDEPKFRFSIRQDPARAEEGPYYLRLHGRNAAQWWDHEDPDDRYNYLYSPGEMREFADAASRAGSRGKAYVYLNNHFAAKAVVNATVLKHQLGQPIRGEYRRDIVERYPELEDIVGPSSEDPLLP
jgi:uncharacterized protein YecE (DUF72 family)